MLKDLLNNIRGYYASFVDLLPRLALAIVLLLLLLGLARFVRGFSQKRLQHRMDDPLLVRFIANLMAMVVIVMAVMLALNIVGLSGVAVGMLSTAGVGAFVIGFAFKDIGENFLAGIVLAFSRPFRIGDTVELGGYEGKVVALNLRDTQMKTPDGKDIFIPNSNIVKNPVINHTLDHFLREQFVIRLNYSTDIGKATAVIQEVLDAAVEVLHTENKAPEVVYHEMSSTSISLLARYWLDISNEKNSAVKVKKRLFDRVKDALKSEKIFLPADLSEITAQASRNTDN